MKMNKIVVTAIAGLACFSAYATDYPAKSLPMTTILSNLESQGYTAKEIKFKDNLFKVEATDKQGKEVDIEVNPETGALNNKDKESAAMTLTMQDAVKKVEAAGYHTIYYIEADDDKYEVKALDKDGKKVSLDVNGKTGEISKDIF